MNQSEAMHTNQLLRWLIEGKRDVDGRRISLEEARESAVFLADRARKACHAGVDGTWVNQRWMHRRVK